MILIGLDTGCVNAKRKVDVLNFVDAMEYFKKLNTEMINISGEELKGYVDGFQKYLNKNKSPQFGRFDEGTFDGSIFGNQETDDRADAIAQKLFGINFHKLTKLPNENFFRDVMIINKAIEDNVDFFLTIDKHFINGDKKEWFENKYHIKVRYVERQDGNFPLILEIGEYLFIKE